MGVDAETWEREMKHRMKDARLREIVAELEKDGMQCRCLLTIYDREGSTRHSCVCPIHLAALAKRNEEREREAD